MTARLCLLLTRDVLAGAVATVSLVAAYQWQQAQPGWPSTSVCLLLGVLSGFYVTGLFHEWGHYLGGIVTRAPMTLLPLSRFPAVYRFDYGASTKRQFDAMSLAGNFASLLFFLIAVASVPLVSPAAIAFISTSLFFCLFTGGLESFAIRASLAGTPPQEAITAIPEDYLRRCAPPALLAAGALFALLWCQLLRG